ncbi:AMP-binding protein [Ornithinimicrobium cryptoxanthini]|uniref:AMP-binding protein n=1 Tax=Ornithinimicrobium cryptoxanthini TaxID=2934161 RepID=A0ABY4YLD1_9MICO|nr:AMP-binding protein [Ornithinimicrobium cryptoxanthini]USQ77608.1 AMP-binding protein [Ornithinimicrobium cryptoxanthini]
MVDTDMMSKQPSYAQGRVDTPLIEQTIGDTLDATARRHGSREALVEVDSGRRWTYAEFLADVDRLARGLLASGIGPGDRVGIWAPNCAGWTLVQFATAKIGAILVTINPSYRTHELAFVLNQSGTRMIVVSEPFKTSDYPTMVEQVRDECPALEHVVVIGRSSWDELLQRAEEVSPERLAEVQGGLAPHDPINIQYTSGTTGFPKGATLSHRNILNNGFFVGEGCSYTEVDRICLPVPFYHCFGMVMGNLAAITHGSCMVIPGRGFDPAGTLRTVREEQITSLYGVPTMFVAEFELMDKGEEFTTADLATVRTGIMAGSLCPASLMRKLVDAGVTDITICYGMTETSPVSTQTTPDDPFDKKVGTVGRVGPHLQIQIVDPTTREVVPRGVAGEFCTKGYSVMLGYWEQPEKTAEVLQDGWMATGDIGVMDDDGYVEITGRIKDLVIRGGENISPREIEEFLYTHPDVLDAQVVGVADPKFGEEVMAWLRMREGTVPLTAEAVREFCSGKLAHYKIPRYVQVIDEFPMTVTGKIRKVELRDRGEEILRAGD